MLSRDVFLQKYVAVHWLYGRAAGRFRHAKTRAQKAVQRRSNINIASVSFFAKRTSSMSIFSACFFCVPI